MNYFNVGVKFGGTDDMWHLFSEKNCWFMGYHENEKPNLDQQAEKVQVGDIFIAKINEMMKYDYQGEVYI